MEKELRVYLFIEKIINSVKKFNEMYKKAIRTNEYV